MIYIDKSYPHTYFHTHTHTSIQQLHISLIAIYLCVNRRINGWHTSCYYPPKTTTTSTRKRKRQQHQLFTTTTYDDNDKHISCLPFSFRRYSDTFTLRIIFKNKILKGEIIENIYFYFFKISSNFTTE